MALESATYISSLASSNPPGGDPAGQAADHIRLIKSVLLSTFPNLNAPVTATPLQLNSPLPVGSILMWCNASSGDIPAGWGLCNGTVYAKVDGSGNITSPNLVDRFIVCSGYTYANGTTGGVVSHTHTVGIAGANLTQAQIPNLSIGISDPGHDHYVNDPGHSHVNNLNGANWGAAAGGVSVAQYTGGSRNTTSGTGIYLSGAYTGISAYTSATGGGVGQAHTHGANTDWQNTLPPYYALAYIMKL